jgi:glutamate--cysteine ligase
MRYGRPSGYRSTRYALWRSIDPGRTSVPTGVEPSEAWARYALAAQVMVIRTPEGPWVADPGFSFADWVGGRTPFPRPTEDDLAYHLTTLFPPVRPRGWFELRFLDQLPDGLWQVAAAVSTALVEDEEAADVAADAADEVQDLTSSAVIAAVSDPRLRRAAQRCFDAATSALPRLNGGRLVPLVTKFRDRYLDRGRCPADDVLDRWRRGEVAARRPVPAGTSARAPAQPRRSLTPELPERHALWP